MTDLLNKYIVQHDEFIQLLAQYYKLHERWMERQSPQRTMDLRGVYKKMRMAVKAMEGTAQLRMKERSEEWKAAHPGKKEKNNDTNDSTD
jgi:hypothetical protein